MMTNYENEQYPTQDDPKKDFVRQVPPPPPTTRPIYSRPVVTGSANYAHAERQPKKSAPNTALIIGVLIVIAVLILGVLGITSCSSAFNSISSGLGVLPKSDSIKADGVPKIGVIDINGTIQYDGTSSSPQGLKILLDRAADNQDIKAVVLRVNSGGGTATAGEEMASYIKNFSKPVIVCSDATNASAAYEISSQADYIFAAKTSAIGAIGVALQITDLSGLYRMLGINIENITSAESKDSSYGTRPLTENERAWYQKMVDQIDQDFINTVAAGRRMEVEKVKELANGMPYTGTEAVEVGLADQIGYIGEAIEYASKLVGYDESQKAVSLTLSSKSDLMNMLDVLGEAKTSDERAVDKLIEKYGSPTSAE